MLYTQRTISVKGECAPIGMYGGQGPVHPVYMGKGTKRRAPDADGWEGPYRKTYIRPWRKKRGLSLERLADRVGEKIGGMTHASLSRIERGLQPYSQPILEAIAEELTGGDVASLLMRNPADPEGMWSIWDQAQPGQRKQIVEVAKTLLKTGT